MFVECKIEVSASASNLRFNAASGTSPATMLQPRCDHLKELFGVEFSVHGLMAVHLKKPAEKKVASALSERDREEEKERMRRRRWRWRWKMRRKPGRRSAG